MFAQREVAAQLLILRQCKHDMGYESVPMRAGCSRSMPAMRHSGCSRPSCYGRMCEITSGRLVEAKQESRWLAVGLLWSNAAGRFGSIPAGQSSRHPAGKRSHADPSNGLRYLFQNASTAFIRRRFSVVT